MKVFGIDVITGSVRSRSQRPRYALVVLSGNDIVEETEVTAFRLFRRLAQEKPDILAVDSVQEVAADARDVFSFLQMLPPSVRLVQVTGGERKESLPKVASRYNISVNRFDPFDEARAIARVAAMGAGCEVIAFENESEIVVSRHRSPGKGGWSQNRYCRKIHGAVLQKAREIEMALLSAGLKYEKRETRAFGGCSRVSFTVQAPREEIPVSASRGADVQVRIHGKRLDRIRFRPLQARPKYLIVGIDPGTTTAVAALDLDGNLLHLESSRQMSMPGVIEALTRIGKPLIVASDVSEMPFSVEKIRRAFNGIAYTPRSDMSVEAKQALTQGYSTRNDHERDALAAALEAYRAYRNKFQNLGKRIPPGFDVDEVRARILRGQSLEQVIGEMAGRELPAPPGAPAAEATGEPGERADEARDERVRILEGTVKRLRAIVAELQEDLRKRDVQIARLEARLKRLRSRRDQKIRSDAEITKRDAIIENLKKKLRTGEKENRRLLKRIQKMKEFDEALLSGETIPLKILPSLTREGVRSLVAEMGIREGDVLYVRKLEGFGKVALRELAEAGIGALLVEAGEEETAFREVEEILRDLSVPVLSTRAVRAVVKGKIGAADPSQFHEAMREWREAQERYEREKKGELLMKIFEEYRTERGREMKKVG
ncbi:MAG: DUF460 domain-containing protein [Methanolinea sp.]|nr:DUF460 domain-containing protein [Methanolinea sp.]